MAKAENARFLKITANSGSVSIEVPQATLVSNVEVIPQPEDTVDRLPPKLKGDAVIWEVYQTVKRDDSGEPISQYSTEIALNRLSGAAEAWDQQWLNESGAKQTPVGNVKYSGQVYKFPFNTKKKDYQVFDRDLKRALPAKFMGTETVEGVETYRFEQRIENVTLPTPEDSVKTLLGRFTPEATSGHVAYTNTRTLWVDPVTGAYLKVREQQRKELRPDIGTPTVLLDADFNYTPETIKKSAETVKENRAKIGLVNLWLPLAAGVLGLIALVAGLVLVARANGSGAHRAATGPTPTRVDQPAVSADARDTAEQPTVDDRGGPLSDEIPPASTNWKGDEPGVPGQRPAPGDVEQR